MISDDDPELMVWEFTDDVAASFNTKDQYGDLVAYAGLSADSFSKCRITMQKKVKSINDLVTEAAAGN